MEINTRRKVAPGSRKRNQKLLVFIISLVEQLEEIFVCIFLIMKNHQHTQPLTSLTPVVEEHVGYVRNSENLILTRSPWYSEDCVCDLEG